MPFVPLQQTSVSLRARFDAKKCNHIEHGAKAVTMPKEEMEDGPLLGQALKLE